MRYALWSLLLARVLCAYLTKEDSLCNPGRNNALAYTGFRMFRQFSYGWPTMHHYLFVHCSHGRVDYQQYVPTARNENYEWNKTVCFNTDFCYKAVRRKRYVQRKLPVYVSNIMLGGLYKCHDEVCAEKSVPILPVLAGDPSHQMMYREGFRIVKLISFAYTPDIASLYYPRVVQMDGIPKWTKHLSNTEQYNYTTRDRFKSWNVANKLANRIHRATSIGSRYIPWEYDVAARELSRDESTKYEYMRSFITILHNLDHQIRSKVQNVS